MIATTNAAKNFESPFTELFLMLKQPEVISTEQLPYKTDTLKAINQHSHNAMDVLLQGLQDVGQLLSTAAQNRKELIDNLPYLGYFISAVSNLAEALHTLRLDVDHALRERGEMHW